MGGGDNSDDEDFEPDESGLSSEDEMDGRTLPEIMADSRKKKAKTKKPISKPKEKAPTELFEATSAQMLSNSTFSTDNNNNFDPNYFSSSNSSTSLILGKNNLSANNPEVSNSLDNSTDQSNLIRARWTNSTNRSMTGFSSNLGDSSSFSASSIMGINASTSTSPSSSTSSSIPFSSFSSSSLPTAIKDINPKRSALNEPTLTNLSIRTHSDTTICYPGHPFIREVKLMDSISPGVDLIATMFSRIDFNDKIDIDWVTQSLWSLFCILAYDALATNHARTSSWEAYLTMVAKFEQIIANLQHMSYYKTRLLDHLPDGDLPLETLTTFNEYKDSLPTKKFLKDAAKHCDQPNVVQMAYFGNRIWNKADEVRRLINGNINPLWVQLTRNKSGSGHNFNAVIEGIRLLTWPMECIIRASNNARTTMSRNKKAVSTSSSSSCQSSSSSSFADSSNPFVGVASREASGRADDEVEDLDDIHLPAYKEVYANQYRKVFVKTKVDLYYPTYWITFLLLGRPAQKDGRPLLEAGIYHIYILYMFEIIFILGIQYQQNRTALSESITAENIDVLSNSGNVYFLYFN
jgi:hypothetical protein